MHSDEEPRAEGLLKSGSNETENCINTDLNINNHLIAQEVERSTVSAASTGAVGEIGEETILPTSETKQCTVLDTCPSVGETELGGTLSSVGSLDLDLCFGDLLRFSFDTDRLPLDLDLDLLLLLLRLDRDRERV